MCLLLQRHSKTIPNRRCCPGPAQLRARHDIKLQTSCVKVRRRAGRTAAAAASANAIIAWDTQPSPWPLLRQTHVCSGEGQCVRHAGSVGSQACGSSVVFVTPKTAKSCWKTDKEVEAKAFLCKLACSRTPSENKYKFSLAHWDWRLADHRPLRLSRPFRV